MQSNKFTNELLINKLTTVEYLIVNRKNEKHIRSNDPVDWLLRLVVIKESLFYLWYIINQSALYNVMYFQKTQMLYNIIAMYNLYISHANHRNISSFG